MQQRIRAAKISGLEAFLTQYPNSVMKEDALELLMVPTSRRNNQAKMHRNGAEGFAGQSLQPAGTGSAAHSPSATAASRAATRSRILTEAGQSGEKGLQCWTDRDQAGRHNRCRFGRS